MTGLKISNSLVEISFLFHGNSLFLYYNVSKFNSKNLIFFVLIKISLTKKPSGLEWKSSSEFIELLGFDCTLKCNNCLSYTFSVACYKKFEIIFYSLPYFDKIFKHILSNHILGLKELCATPVVFIILEHFVISSFNKFYL